MEEPISTTQIIRDVNQSLETETVSDELREKIAQLIERAELLNTLYAADGLYRPGH